MTKPVRVGEVLPEVVAEAIARAGPVYDRWMDQVAATGYCAHPVRLRGTVEHADAATGEVRTAYDTDREPDATLRKACGNRRVSVCPSCSATYEADSFQLLAAGLRGGKGVPETVSAHPRLFVTFTAPSFGQVHSRKSQGLLAYPCHPYRQGQRCPHGKRAGCWQRHDADDPAWGAAVPAQLPGWCAGALERPGRPAVVTDHHLPLPHPHSARRPQRDRAAPAGVVELPARQAADGA